MQGLPVVVVLATASDRSFLLSRSCVSAPWLLRQKQGKSWRNGDRVGQFSPESNDRIIILEKCIAFLEAIYIYIRTAATQGKCCFPPLGTLNV